MKKCVVVLGGFLVTVLLPIFAVLPASATETTDIIPAVIISEIKLGGDSYSQGLNQPKDPQEFITLYNQSDTEVDLQGWTLEYAKVTFDKAFCGDADWMAHSVNGSVSLSELSGSLKPHQVSTPIVRSLTDKVEGSLRIVNRSDALNPTVQDLVGWGINAPCAENNPTSIPANGTSLKRFLDCDSNNPLDTNDNNLDFATDQPPSPGSLDSPYVTDCQQDTTTDQSQTPQPTCEGVIISEFLPNPAGADTGNEYIELYNPTGETISLTGCSLQTSASSKTYNFSDAALQSKEYQAFYNEETGLTLSNSNGGTVWLLSPTTELQAITYPSDLDDNDSWALSGGSWYATYKLTPGASNIIEEFKPCPAGQQRNPATGYCRNVVTLTTSTLGTCPAGKVRNPATNRCRYIASSGSTLTPCKPGQTRNPATNRCKAVATLASASLKPCAPGQERNPSTHRCRKATSANASNLPNVKDVASGSIASNPHWLLAGLAIAGATSYGIYEWRQEVLQLLSRLKTKLPKFS